MHALRQDDCAGCTGPVRQKCKERPAIPTLASTLPPTAAHGSTLLGDQLRFEIKEPFDAETAAPKRAHWTARLKAGIAGFRERAAQRRLDRQIALELSRLDDRTLRDIGISRPVIEAAIASAQRSGR
jgi:uncharacterized protein YjiS (DUF1127 family)